MKYSRRKVTKSIDIIDDWLAEYGTIQVRELVLKQVKELIQQYDRKKKENL